MKWLLRGVGRAFLSLQGWEERGEVPKSCVLIGAPHTSNWDVPFSLALAFVWGIRFRWAGKHSLFKFPMGLIMRATGGIPIVRHERRNRVEQLAALFAEHDDLVLMVSSEGTRGRTEYWKSGFYHIARTAKVPIVCGFLDYKRRRGGFGISVMPSGDVQADMDKIRAFYADITGRDHSRFGPVRLKDESPLPAD